MDTYSRQQNDEFVMRGDYTSATVVSTAANYFWTRVAYSHIHIDPIFNFERMDH